MAEEHAMVYPPINFLCIGAKLKGNTQGQLSVSAAADHTAAFETSGLYDVWCDVDVYLKVATTANDVTTSTGYLVRANTTIPIVIGAGDKLGAIAGGAGTLRYHKVS